MPLSICCSIIEEGYVKGMVIIQTFFVRGVGEGP